MSFEEKYNRYKKSPKMDVSEDYINKTVERVSNKISSDTKKPRMWVWGISATVAAFTLFILVLGPLPFIPDPQKTITQQPTEVEHRITQLAIDTHLNDSGNLVAIPNKKISVVNGNELDQESIIEYLLDEGYEEI